MQNDETAEEAFNCHIVSNPRCSKQHEKLTKLLEAQNSLKNIDDARAEKIGEQQDNNDDDEPQINGSN